MQPKLTFIHSADLHLDSPFKGAENLPNKMIERLRESTFLAYENLINDAIKYRVDFVLIVGDVFDQEVQSIKAHIHLVDGFKKLQEHDIQVFLSFGNHDFVSAQSFKRDYPANVHVFENNQVESKVFYKNEQPVATIYGFSYQEQAERKNRTEEYVRTGESFFHIAMLHGSIGDKENQVHARYAPFQLHELLMKQFDYWALGHIHKREVLKTVPTIVYPGNIQGRSIKEADEKGGYLVELTASESKLTFLPFQSIQYKKVILEANNYEHLPTFTADIQENLERVHQKSGDCIVEIVLKNPNEEIREWDHTKQLLEVQELVNDRLQANNISVALSKFRISYNRSNSIGIEAGNFFLTELSKQFKSGQNLDEMLDPLLTHPVGRKFLQPFDRESEEEILSEAIALLEQLFHEKI